MSSIKDLGSAQSRERDLGKKLEKLQKTETDAQKEKEDGAAAKKAAQAKIKKNRTDQRAADEALEQSAADRLVATAPLEQAQNTLRQAEQAVLYPKPSKSIRDTASFRNALLPPQEVVVNGVVKKVRYWAPAIGFAESASEGAGGTAIAYAAANARTQPVEITAGVSAAGVVLLSAPSARELMKLFRDPFEAWEAIVRNSVTAEPKPADADEITTALSIRAKEMQALAGAFINLAAANGLIQNTAVTAVSLGCSAISVGAASWRKSHLTGTIDKARVIEQVGSSDKEISEFGKKRLNKLVDHSHRLGAILPLGFAIGAGLGGLMAAIFCLRKLGAGESPSDYATEATGEFKLGEGDYLGARVFAVAANLALLTKNLIIYANAAMEWPAAAARADAATIRREEQTRSDTLSDAQDVFHDTLATFNAADESATQAVALLANLARELTLAKQEDTDADKKISEADTKVTQAHQEIAKLKNELNAVSASIKEMIKQQQQNKDDDDDHGPMTV